jgi:hypothetical protein
LVLRRDSATYARLRPSGSPGIGCSGDGSPASRHAPAPGSAHSTGRSPRARSRRGDRRRSRRATWVRVRSRSRVRAACPPARP